ncbi:hypothetical protein QR680_007833 [Steinernema hermaphroditum]|uniref:Uncharacterized protein n=1 Tax=Steinernema hermaphroditum TaxID=289476 RepID=A0AA39IGK9_9BILA|nr:hypothetical protein QR680_007833 [Steinernema hermaphroditum]
MPLPERNKSACNKLAKGIVANLLKRAIQRVNEEKTSIYPYHGCLLRERSLPPIQPERAPSPHVIQRSTTYGSLPHLPTVAFPPSAHFTRDLGIKKIAEIIDKTWSYGSLRYSVSFLCVVPLQRFDRYKYAVTWMAPYGTSANVFFNVDSARVDIWRPVHVSYTFDTGKVVRTPMQSSSYHNEWLSALEANDIATHRYFARTGRAMHVGGSP